MKTRSQTKTTAQRTLAAPQDIEDAFRKIHREGFVLVNPSDLTDVRRVLWWSTGVEEGVFNDDDIPAGDYEAVYETMHGR